jgi:hypothetical protein
MPEKSQSGIGISCGSQLPQSGIRVQSGTACHGLVWHCPAMGLFKAADYTHVSYTRKQVVYCTVSADFQEVARMCGCERQSSLLASVSTWATMTCGTFCHVTLTFRTLITGTYCPFTFQAVGAYVAACHILVSIDNFVHLLCSMCSTRQEKITSAKKQY